jgi:hypothetical protein
MSESDDFRQLDDPEFLAERKRVREALEHQPEASAELAERYERLDEEFLRRARIAWGQR